MASILITGASGFIGSFIVEEALKRKFAVWAGIRSSSSKKYLRERKIHFLELDFAHPNELRAQLSGHKGTYNKFDYIVHCAGLTKCRDKKEFDLVNYLQTKYFVDTLRELNMVPKQFIYISTLSVFGPVHEKDYAPIKETDICAPNTAYGLSKLKAELYIQSIPGFPYVFYRPTGVYGPREMDYFLMAKSIRNHMDFSVGFKRQDLTFVYVKDICKVVKFMIEHEEVSGLFNLGTGQARSFYDLAASTFKAMGLEPNIKYIEMPESLHAKYQYYTQANMEKLRNVGYADDFYSLEDGAKDYVQNYLMKNYETY